MVRGVRPLWASGRSLLFSRGPNLLWSDRYNGVKPIATLRSADRFRTLSNPSVIRRVGRGGYHDAVRLSDTEFALIVRGAIARVDIGSGVLELTHHIVEGSRPLGLAMSDRGIIAFGEYFGNPGRRGVSVYASYDSGHTYETVYRFGAGQIRHVHRLVWDPFRRGFWILTGDDDQESGLWFVDEGFDGAPSLRFGGLQRFRAVDLLPLAGGLVLPTDTPIESNAIWFLDLNSDRQQMLEPLMGSAFDAQASRDGFLVTTVMEPSEANKPPGVGVYVSADGYTWKHVVTWPQDAFSRSISPRLSQYSRLRLATVSSDSKAVGHGIGLRRAHDALVLLDLSSLLQQSAQRNHQ